MIRYLGLFATFIVDLLVRRRPSRDCERDLIVALSADGGDDHESDVDLVEDIIDWRDTEVRELYVPLPEMHMIRRPSTMDELLQSISSEGFSRYPVYENEPRSVAGIIDIKDVISMLARDRDAGIDALLRPPFLVPESKNVAELLSDFRANGARMAIVIDEFGEVSGLVTRTDIIEKLLMDVAGDEQHKAVHKGKDGWYTVEGTWPLDDLFDLLSMSDDTEHRVDTVAGYVLLKLGRIPARGERFMLDGKIEVVVSDADERRIKVLRFKPL